MDVLDVSRRFLADRFPLATMAIVGGSSARGTRTPTSDIDLLVVAPAAQFARGTDSIAATYAFDAEIFEVFAYTPESFTWWAEHDLDDHHPVLQAILMEGLVILGEADAADLRATWAPRLEAGPRVRPTALLHHRHARRPHRRD